MTPEQIVTKFLTEAMHLSIAGKEAFLKDIQNYQPDQFIKVWFLIAPKLNEQEREQIVSKLKIDANDPIELTPYNPEWPKLAQLEIDKLKKILPTEQVIDIQHIGSTAIPNISAKPIIDIQIAVASLEKIKLIAISELKNLGYIFWDFNPDPTRLVFIKGLPPHGEKRTHYVHIVEPNSKHWQDKILFRDYLRAHPNAAKEYENLKLHLEKQYKYDREKYTEAKSEFIKKILKEARENRNN